MTKDEYSIFPVLILIENPIIIVGSILNLSVVLLLVKVFKRKVLLHIVYYSGLKWTRLTMIYLY